MKIKYITINNIDYLIVIEKQGYLYLVNENNPKDFCIRKNKIIDGEEFVAPLDSDEEFDKALKLFVEEKTT